MKRKVLGILLVLFGLVSCRQPEIIYADFADFHPYAVTESSLTMGDGSLNPEMLVMANTAWDTDTLSEFICSPNSFGILQRFGTHYIGVLLCQ